jgi:hypothetical protein
LLVVWLLFVLAFVVLVIGLVYRRGKLIRQHLTDEVALGHLTQAELDLVTSVFGTVTAMIRKGFRGQEFVRAVARLGLSKWHTARAMKGSKGDRLDGLHPPAAREDPSAPPRRRLSCVSPRQKNDQPRPR